MLQRCPAAAARRLWGCAEEVVLLVAAHSSAAPKAELAGAHPHYTAPGGSTHMALCPYNLS